jgi:hypothetical protein
MLSAIAETKMFDKMCIRSITNYIVNHEIECGLNPDMSPQLFNYHIEGRRVNPVGEECYTYINIKIFYGGVGQFANGVGDLTAYEKHTEKVNIEWGNIGHGIGFKYERYYLKD